jgi:hypothetical protein
MCGPLFIKALSSRLAMNILSCFRNRRMYLILVGTLVLLAGLALAAVVYLTATDNGSGASGIQAVVGDRYEIVARDSKQYLSDVQNIGGLSAVLADKLNVWFADLWHGKRLAYTLAVLAAGGALGCFLAANLLSRPQSPGRTRDQGR